MRPSQRLAAQLREVRITRRYTCHAEGSVLIEMGGTQVLCTASVEAAVPSFLRGQGRGWVTAEYGMLPRSTQARVSRETNQPSGRTQEIQRLVGRALRAVVDLSKIKDFSICIDCDVIQADGGTRTAAVTGAWLAMNDAFERWRKAGKIRTNPVFDQLAAVSVGVVDGVALLDLDYREDSRAEVDMNLVMTGGGEFVEVQGTGERKGFDRAQLDRLLDLGTGGLQTLFDLQKQAQA